MSIDNNAGIVTFFGYIGEVNFVLSELWIDSKFDENFTVNITVDDSINRKIESSTSIKVFNIYDEIGFVYNL